MREEHLKMIAEMHSSKITNLEQNIATYTRHIARLGSDLDRDLKQIDKLKNYLAEICMAIVQSEKCKSGECDCSEEDDE